MNQIVVSSDYISDNDGSKDASLEDDALIQLASVGNKQAFIQLYQNFRRPIYNFICRLIHDEVGAEDVLQEVFIAVWRGANRFKGNSSVKTWIYRIAYNQSMSWLRTHRHEIKALSIDDPPLIDLEDSGDIWDSEKIQKALNQLSVKHRAVVELTFVSGMSYREVSVTLGIPIGTVKSRMKYALKSLAQSLENMGINQKDT